MRRPPCVIVLIGPSALLREGLARILGAANFRVVASASCIDDLVATALPQHRSTLLIIDAGGDLNAAIRQFEVFKERHPTGRIAILADQNQPSDIVSAFRAGANAFFFKVGPCDTFIKSLELVMLGETILPAAILSMILDRRDDNDDHECEVAVQHVRKAAGDYLQAESRDMPRLSVRERCILNYLIAGDSNKVIARKIDIADATVKVHVKAILRKIRVQNRTQAAIWAISNGLSISGERGGSPVSYLTSGPSSSATQRHALALLPAVSQTVSELPSVDRLGIR
jgi:two-component system nitrate/nitrite response regulator NarL